MALELGASQQDNRPCCRDVPFRLRVGGLWQMLTLLKRVIRIYIFVYVYVSVSVCVFVFPP